MVILIIYACAYDNAEDLYGKTECPPEGVSFSTTITPIIGSNCAVSGCHIHGQQLPTLESYDQISANAAAIKLRTNNGTMPPSTSGKSLSGEEITLISCWIESGSPDN